jgi:hypothetical protein
MDGSRFDALSRALVAGSSRRAATRLIGAIALGAPLAFREPSETVAKHKKHKKKHKGASPTPPPCPEGTRRCGDQCLSVLICCDETDCAGGRTCQQGTCVCPANRPHGDCPGSGVCQECCDISDCRPPASDGQECQAGQCVCTFAGTRRCPDGLCGSCCDDSECRGGQQCLSFGSDRHCQCAPVGETLCHGLCIPTGCAAFCDAPCAADPTCCGGLSCKPDSAGTPRCLP